MNKKGQFYLVAAIIIICILAGIAMYKNYAKIDKGNTVVYDLGKELKIETGNVYDYSIYNNKNTNEVIANWTSRYYDYARTQGSTDSWIFVYGNREEMTAMLFSTAEAGSVSIDTGSGETKVSVLKNIRTPIKNIDFSKGDVNINFNGVKYPFKLEEGENFYFVIKGGSATAT